jgi:hypothetical protein
LDLVVPGIDPGECESLERGELGQGFVPFGDVLLACGDMDLEPLDLPSARVGRRPCPLQSRKAPLELFGEVR